MKDYEVIYNTKSMKGVRYAFKAEDSKAAIEKAYKLVTGKITDVVEVDDLGKKICSVLTSKN